MPSGEQIILTDGAMDWSGGVNSIKVTTIASQVNKNGIDRSELCWLDNGTVRGGGITQRSAWVNKGTLPLAGVMAGVVAANAPSGSGYMGSETYVPLVGNPYQLMVFFGEVWKVDPDDTANAINLSSQFGIILPTTDRCYFCQAEMFMVIQCGDGVTLPLFWDGVKLWQSIGIVSNTATSASPPHTNEIPAAQSMCYYMGRLWYAQGRTCSAGDIVNGPTAYPAPGPPYYQGRDSVLCVQENPLCVGGDGFTVPTSAGNITAIAYASNINVTLGQGTLYVGTREQIYSLTVPVTRADWIAANVNNQPIMTVALATNGWVNDRSIVAVNGDLFFQSLEPSIRSLTVAVRNFGTWGNVPISINEYRLLQFNDRSLLWAGSGRYFDNRLYQTALPYRCPVGVAHKALAPLNFDVISSLWGQLTNLQATGATQDFPAWEGMTEGLNILELADEDFGGEQRLFAFVWDDPTQTIQLWENLIAGQFDDNTNRVLWYIEFPAFTFGHELDLKKLVSAEVWFDSLYGIADFRMDYRPDGYVCWFPWLGWSCCTQGAQTTPTPQYPQPQAVNLQQSYRQYQVLPSPPLDCAAPMMRPSNVGYQFQCRLTIHGYCRIRALFLHAEPIKRNLYEGLVCTT